MFYAGGEDRMGGVGDDGGGWRRFLRAAMGMVGRWTIGVGERPSCLANECVTR